ASSPAPRCYPRSPCSFSPFFIFPRCLDKVQRTTGVPVPASVAGLVEVTFCPAPDRVAPNCAHLGDLAPARQRRLQRNIAEISRYALCVGLSVCEKNRQAFWATS